jgi:hypothetical protein
VHHHYEVRNFTTAEVVELTEQTNYFVCVHVRRFTRSKTTGHVPSILFPWLSELAKVKPAGVSKRQSLKSVFKRRKHLCRASKVSFLFSFCQRTQIITRIAVPGIINLSQSSSLIFLTLTYICDTTLSSTTITKINLYEISCCPIILIFLHYVIFSSNLI